MVATTVRISLASLALAVSVGASSLQGQDALPRPAPEFRANGSDGKTHTLASLAEGDKTVVLYFIKEHCGANPGAVPLFKAVAEPFREAKNVRFVAVINCGAEAYAAFQKTYGLEMFALVDPGHEVIKAYGVRRSQGSMVVRGGQIVHEWKGYSKASLEELGSVLGKAEGLEFKADLSRAPGRESFG